MNRATLIGNLGRDPEIKTTNDGRKYARFSIATTERWTDKASGEKREKTQWHDIVVWSEGLVGVVEKFCKKGSKILVEGQIETREWHKEGTPDDDKRYATSIVLNGFAATLQLLDRPPSNRPPDPDYPEGPGARTPAAANGARPNRGIDDEIPF